MGRTFLSGTHQIPRGRTLSAPVCMLSVAIPPTIHRAPEPEFPQNCWGNCQLEFQGECRGNCCRDCPCLEEQRSGSLRSSPSFFGSFSSNLHSNIGKSGLHTPVDGRGNGKLSGQALTTQTQNAAFFECKGSERRGWPRGRPLNRKKFGHL